MEAIVHFHDDLMFYVCFITVFVLYMLVRTVSIFNIFTPHEKYLKNQEVNMVYFNRLTHHTGLEIF